MKKHLISVAVISAIAASTLCSSCIGSFALTRKLLNWNNQVSNKFVNELVFFAFWIIPVYEVAAVADALVIISIEFWSGSNPVAVGKSVINGQDGRYLVECDGKGYTITPEDGGKAIRLDFEQDDRSWNLTTAEGAQYKLITFVDDTHVLLPSLSGEPRLTELSEAGLLAYRAEVQSALLASR